MSSFPPTSGFKWIDPKEFDLSKWKGCVLEVDLEYTKELPELDNDYSLAPDKIEISREMLPEYQLRITVLYNIYFGSSMKLVTNFLDKEKYVLYYENLQIYLRLRLKLKKSTSRISIQSIAMVKTIYWIKHTKKNISRKKWGWRWKCIVQTNNE